VNCQTRSSRAFFYFLPIWAGKFAFFRATAGLKCSPLFSALRFGAERRIYFSPGILAHSTFNPGVIMCPHCLSVPGGCVHCRPDRALRPPTQASIAAAKTADERTGVTRSLLTNADRVALGIFTKPWRGVARETGYNPQTPRRKAESGQRTFNCVLPANFSLA
jgi:hypothetical protein